MSRCQLPLYADDTVIYVSAKTASKAADHLTQALDKVTNWLELSHLTLNVKKTVSMCMSIRNKPVNDLFEAKIKNEITTEVNEVKYLGIILDKNLKFDKQVQYICKKVKPNLNSFRFIRRDLSCKAAQLYMHAMILSDLSYCITSWSQASQVTLKPAVAMYKQAIKIMDQKPMRWHHCGILRKYNLLTFENFIIYTNIKLFFKCLHNYVSPLFSALIKRRWNSSQINTRTSDNCNYNCDCIVPRCTTSFVHSAFTVKGVNLWNTLPTHLRTKGMVNNKTMFTCINMDCSVILNITVVIITLICFISFLLTICVCF